MYRNWIDLQCDSQQNTSEVSKYVKASYILHYHGMAKSHHKHRADTGRLLMQYFMHFSSIEILLVRSHIVSLSIALIFYNAWWCLRSAPSISLVDRISVPYSYRFEKYCSTATKIINHPTVSNQWLGSQKRHTGPETFDHTETLWGPSVLKVEFYFTFHSSKIF